MPSFDASAVSCRVYAFKEGLLSAVGHDVALSVDALDVSVEGDKLTASFDPARLRVLYAMRDGTPNEGALSDKDKKTIEGYVREDILHSRRYPKIRFTSTSISADEDADDGALRIEGTLDLHGRVRTITARAVRSEGIWKARVRLNQPDFGITPFRAMLGALRIQPHVEIEISVPEAALQGLV